ncbi:uncharacterized protein LOC126704759 [Quercus robur]|uniref:uncharacterized protein LOC126704759 n=1 Tax=Quercus robur TaxID=38942 RepID=UPI002162F06A|nr:uncharacterized protein LOC126704759 [Quercus robur]
MPIDKILAHIKYEHYLKWLRPLHSSPNVRDKKKYCHFHKDYNHYTENCRDLKEQIEELIRKGKLQRFVKKGEPSRSKDDNKDKHETSPRDEDHKSQHIPSVTGEIKTITGGLSTGFNTRRILMDNGNSVDIIYLSAFQQLKLDLERLYPFESPLISFSGDRVYPKSIVTLTVTVGSYLQ